MPAAALTINGTPRDLVAGSVDVILNINGRSTLSVDVRSLDGSYIPEFEDDVVLTDASANILFAGMVMDPTERWLVQGKSHVFTKIECEDYTSYADRVLVSASTTGGITGRDAIDYLVANHLTDFGVTRDAAMPAGATLGALTYDYATCTDVLNDIVKLAAPDGWVWYIDAAKVLRAWAPSLASFPCPWSISPSATHIVGDVAVSRSRQYYANRAYLVYGNGTATPAVVSAQSVGEQTLYGLFEAVVRSDGPFDAPTAQAIIDAYLTKTVVRPQTIVFNTLEPGARPGLTIDVDLPLRNLAGDYLITEVAISDLGGAELMYRVTAIEGGVLAPNWKDGARGGGGSGVLSGSVVVTTGVLASGTISLGGGSAQAVIPGSGTWLPVVNAVPFVAPATRTVTVRADLWARSGSVTVTARLRDLSTGSTVGTSSGVTGSTPTLVSFTASVVATRRYELQLSANAADEGVFGLGSLEFV